MSCSKPQEGRDPDLTHRRAVPPEASKDRSQEKETGFQYPWWPVAERFSRMPRVGVEPTMMESRRLSENSVLNCVRP